MRRSLLVPMPRQTTRSVLLALACAAAALPAAGCGAADADGGGASSPNATPPPPPREVAAARHPVAGDFPATRGRTLRRLADSLSGGGPSVALATSEYAPGPNRVAFGLIQPDGAFLYGDTAVYAARGADAPVRGPIPAPADSLEVRPPFRSETSAGDADDVKAVYRAEVELPRPGRWLLLVVTRDGGRLTGGVAVVTVRRTSAVPAVGDAAPRVHTPTLAS